MFVYGLCNQAWYVDTMTMFDFLPYFGSADVMYLDIIFAHTYLLCSSGKIIPYISWERMYKNMIQWFCRICPICLMMTMFVFLVFVRIFWKGIIYYLGFLISYVFLDHIWLQPLIPQLSWGIVCFFVLCLSGWILWIQDCKLWINTYMNIICFPVRELYGIFDSVDSSSSE